MNWPLILLTGFAAGILICLLVKRNIKDEKMLEKEIKNNYHKPRDEEGDIEVDEKMH